MKRKGKKFKLALTVLVMLSAVSLSVQRASALSFDLTASNLGAGFPQPYATINISLSGQIATVTVTGDLTGSIQYLMTDGSSVALNVNSSNFSIVSGAPGITGTNIGGGTINDYSIADPPGTSQVDGFGKFNLTIDAANANMDHSAKTITFQIQNSGTAWSSDADVLTPNDATHDAVAAAHIGACNTPCSLNSSFTKTGFAAGSGDNTVPPTEIPEPSTLLLLGAGIVAISAFARSRLGSR